MTAKTSYDTALTVQSGVQPLESVLRRLAQGTVRLPAFTQPFAWDDVQILALLDSVERGWPIGTLLYWEPETPMRSADQVGDLAVPPAPAGSRPSYVLDGHQRLAALYAALHHRTGEGDTTASGQRWRLYRMLGPDAEAGPYPYRHVPHNVEPPAHYLPTNAMQRTVDFLKACRGLDDTLIDEAGHVAQRIKEYQVPIVQLTGGTLDEVVEVYLRLNTAGTVRSRAELAGAFT